MTTASAIDYAKILLLSPKRLETATKFKVAYEHNKGKLYVDFKNAQLIGTKKGDSYWYVKLVCSKNDLKMISRLQDALVKASKDIIPPLIKDIEDEDAVEDLFTSVIHVNDDCGMYLKLRCTETFAPGESTSLIAQLAETRDDYVDLRFVILNVKYIKHSLHTTWDLVTIEPSAGPVAAGGATGGRDAFLDDDEDDRVAGGECDIDLDNEVLDELVKDAHIDLSTRICEIESEIEKLTIDKSLFIDALDVLLQKPASIAAIDYVQELLCAGAQE